MQSIFGTDGIRGEFDKEINFSLAYKVGYALGLISKENGPILIGRDTRVSGEILLEAISNGINDSGKEFINIGICPTPAIPFLIKHRKFCSGVMISASHNPPEFNGIKIFDHEGKKITKKFETNIESIISQTKSNNFSQRKTISIKTNEYLLESYIQSLINTMGDEKLDGLKIILDTCYGSATTCAEKIFKTLGANVKVINQDKNGLKINLNCGSTFLNPIIKAVIENNADMGFSFDGDADRVIGVDSKGNILDGDHTLFLLGREMMKKKSLTNNLIITTKMANLGFENAWNKIGGKFYRTEVGDKFIYEEIQRQKAILGGEQSGHILSKINNFSGDGILTAIQISKLCKNKNISLHNLLKSSFRPYAQKLINIKLNFNINEINANTKNNIDQIIEKYTTYTTDNCRVYIRPSGTEPLLRILVEADNLEKVKNLSVELTAKITQEISRIK
tara:strand:- start:839 stop:2188 length:1350 start_codon:yes stop_codon:yes gene_type:complete